MNTRASSVIGFTSLTRKTKDIYGHIILAGIKYRVIDDRPDIDRLKVDDIVMIHSN